MLSINVLEHSVEGERPILDFESGRCEKLYSFNFRGISPPQKIQTPVVFKLHAIVQMWASAHSFKGGSRLWLPVKCAQGDPLLHSTN